MPASDTPIDDRDLLAEVFRSAEKPAKQWRIGAEAEKFGVHAETGAPLQYDGDHGVVRVLGSLEAKGWTAVRERPDGPVISLTRDDANITLEPGSQLELSGSPRDDTHEICGELRHHLDELGDISKEMNLAWLGVGFHPLASQDELSWVPKQRYSIMREYLPPRGRRAIDMMRRTATVQANFDYSDETDAMRKLRVSLILSPLVHAMMANSPFYEGKPSGKKSLRGEVWLDMDPERSGLIPRLWEKERPAYDDYVDWALDAGMFLFWRDGRVIDNRGQTFRAFLEDGFEGHRARYGDWELHLQTLFPEARLKRTLEVRCCDSLPRDLACALPALFIGILYDDAALDEAEDLANELVREVGPRGIEAIRPALCAQGLATTLGTVPARDLALRLLDISAGGLKRRARLTPGGRDESIHLERLRELNERGDSPADRLTEGVTDAKCTPAEIVSRARV